MVLADEKFSLRPGSKSSIVEIEECGILCDVGHTDPLGSHLGSSGWRVVLWERLSGLEQVKRKG